MRKALMATMALALVVVLCAAKATIVPKDEQKPSADAVADAARIVQRAFDDLDHDDAASAESELERAFRNKGFARLPEDTRYRALLVASLIALDNNDSKRAHELSIQATAFEEAGNTAWMTRLSSAFSIGDYHDAGYSQTYFIKRWPEKLDDINPVAIWQLHGQLKRSHDLDLDRQMLDELFDAEWQSRGVEPSDMWRDLALLHLQRDEIDRAATVAARITSGQTALGMLVDKRFDPVTSRHPDAFDVDRLIAAEIAAAEDRAKQHPDQLMPITDLQELYLITRQYPRVLSISEAAVAHARSGDGRKTYTDFAERYNWVLDNRSRALKRQGHWDEAAKVEERAARHPEQGAMNVSQLINLGELYADLGRPDEAAGAIAEVGEMSPFGRMQLESVRLRIAFDRKDAAAFGAAMDYMREHRADAIATWEDALLLHGDLDAAAALLVERLENPEWRNDALVDLQRFDEVTVTPVEKVIQERWHAIVARPDVQAAVQKVGRVGRFHIAAPLR